MSLSRVTKTSCRRNDPAQLTPRCHLQPTKNCAANNSNRSGARFQCPISCWTIAEDRQEAVLTAISKTAQTPKFDHRTRKKVKTKRKHSLVVCTIPLSRPFLAAYSLPKPQEKERGRPVARQKQQTQLTHSLTRSLARSLTHSLTHSPTHPLTHFHSDSTRTLLRRPVGVPLLVPVGPLVHHVDVVVPRHAPPQGAHGVQAPEPGARGVVVRRDELQGMSVLTDPSFFFRTEKLGGEGGVAGRGGGGGGEKLGVHQRGFSKNKCVLASRSSSLFFGGWVAGRRGGGGGGEDAGGGGGGRGDAKKDT